MSNERTYDWDEPAIEKPNESNFILLEPGIYPFTVEKFERGRHEGSAKLPPCKKAIIHCCIDGGDQGTTTLKSNLFLHSKCDGLLCQFFEAIGMRKHGDPLVMDWDKVEGSKGFLKTKHRTFRGKQGNDVTVTDIDRFVNGPGSDNGATAQAAPAAEDDGDTAFPWES